MTKNIKLRIGSLSLCKADSWWYGINWCLDIQETKLGFYFKSGRYAGDYFVAMHHK